MLNIIAITSSNTSKPQDDMQLSNNEYTTTNPQNDDSFGKHQKIVNTKSKLETPIPEVDDIYFSIKDENGTFHLPKPNSPIWDHFDCTITHSNSTQGQMKYVYDHINGVACKSPDGENPGKSYISPEICLMVNHEIQNQIFVYDQQKYNLKLELINNDGLFSLFSLIETKEGIFVSYVLVFFQYDGYFYCSVVPMSDNQTIESVYNSMTEKPDEFFKNYVLSSSGNIPGHVMEQITQILSTLYDSEAPTVSKSIDNMGEDNYRETNILPSICIHSENNYINNLWKPLNGMTEEEKQITKGALIIHNENMIMNGDIPEYQISESQMIWELIGNGHFRYLEILNTVPEDLFEGVDFNRDTYHVFSLNRQANEDIPNGGFMFFCNPTYKEMLFCAQFVLYENRQREYKTVDIEGIRKIYFILKTTNVVYYLSKGKKYIGHKLLPIQEDRESSISSVSDEYSGNSEKEENVVGNFLSMESSSNNDEKENTMEQNSISNKNNMKSSEKECSNTSNTNGDMNIFPRPDITNDGEEEVRVYIINKGPNEEEAVSDHKCCTKYLTIRTEDNGNHVETVHQIKVDQVELLNFDEHICDDSKVYLFDPKSKLVSKNEVGLSEDNISAVSISFVEENMTFKKICLIENQSYFENQTDLHFFPFYFIHKLGDDIKVKRIIIFFYIGNSDILYCQAFEGDILLNELEGLITTDTKAFISKISKGTNIRSLKEIVSILETQILFDKLQDKGTYAQVSYKPDMGEEKLFVETFVEGILKKSVETLQKEFSEKNTEGVNENLTNADIANTNTSSFNESTYKQTTSVKDRILNLFNGVGKRIREILRRLLEII